MESKISSAGLARIDWSIKRIATLLIVHKVLVFLVSPFELNAELILDDPIICDHMDTHLRHLYFGLLQVYDHVLHILYNPQHSLLSFPLQLAQQPRFA